MNMTQAQLFSKKLEDRGNWKKFKLESPSLERESESYLTQRIKIKIWEIKSESRES